jgi:uncharacterized protein YkwD
VDESRHRDPRGWVAVGVALVVVLATAAQASADPRLLSTKLSGPAVVGRSSGLTIRAVDPEAPVGGAVVTYGSEGALGTSACAAPDSEGRAPGPPFAPGSPVTMSLPHTFKHAGKLAGLLRVDSGSCVVSGDSLLQPFTATLVKPGQPPQPLVLGTPVLQPIGSPPPTLPGVPGLPPLPPLPPVPTPPVTLPSPPALPVEPPTLPDIPIGGVRAAKAACPGAGRRIGKSARARVKARRAVLCLLNRERRKRGLKRLRSQQRLFKASFRHSRAMVKRRFFSHVQPGGVGLLTRLTRTHYLPSSSWFVGENIAWGRGSFDSPLSMVRAWMHSTGHRANILRPAFRQIGIGIYRGVPTGRRTGATYTTDFGFRR